MSNKPRGSKHHIYQHDFSFDTDCDDVDDNEAFHDADTFDLDMPIYEVQKQ